jgi:hypothetical protein
MALAPVTTERMLKSDIHAAEIRMTLLIPTINGVVFVVLGLIDKYVLH